MLHQLGFLEATWCKLPLACPFYTLMLKCHSMWLLIMHGIVKERRALFQTLLVVAGKAKRQMVVSLFMHLAQAPQLSCS